MIPAIRVAINAKHRRFANPKGPEGRLMMLRKTVTELVKLERVELNYHRGDEARGYAERVRLRHLQYLLACTSAISHTGMSNTWYDKHVNPFTYTIRQPMR